MTDALQAEAGPTLPPQRILAVADATPPTRNAIWRAALLARETGASLHVLHVLRDAAGMEAARSSLEQLCAGILQRVGVQATIEVQRGDLPKEAARASRDADLLVLASRPGNTLRERISGTPVERLIRLSRIPALVVKRPAAPPRGASLADAALRGRYGRVLVSVDLGRDAAGVIAAASQFSHDPAMEVFHAVSARREGPRGSAADAAVAGGTAIERARVTVKAAIAAAGMRGQGAAACVGFGGAAPSVLTRQRAIGAELLVIGKRQRGLFADYFLGGITQQVLAGSRSDVLVVPTRTPRGAAEPAAGGARAGASDADPAPALGTHGAGAWPS